MNRSAASAARIRRWVGQRWRWVLLATVTAALLLSAWAFLSAVRRPTWYRPVAIDRTLLREDKRDLVALADGIGASLNSGERAVFEVDAGQLNRWLSAREEIWPELVLPAGLDDPVVVFENDRIRVGVTVSRGDWRFVLGAEGSVRAAGDAVEVDIRSVRVGSLPVPQGWLLDVCRKALAASGSSVSGRVESGRIVLSNRWVWPNGQRAYRVESVSVSDGRMNVVLSPRGWR